MVDLCLHGKYPGVITSYKQLSCQVYWASQCSDADGPQMPPDHIGGVDVGIWHPADRGQAYNDLLARSNSVRIGGDTMLLSATTSAYPAIAL